MIEVSVRFQNGGFIFDSEDPDALMRDAKRYRRTGRQMIRNLRSGKHAGQGDSMLRSLENLAEACERRAADLRREA